MKFDKLEAYGFECDAGSLKECEDWTSLKGEVVRLENSEEALGALSSELETKLRQSENNLLVVARGFGEMVKILKNPEKTPDSHLLDCAGFFLADMLKRGEL